MKRYLALGAVAIQSLCATALYSNTASARDITFGILGPHEYELPVNYKDFFVFVQYTQFDSSSQTFDASGNLSRIPRQQLGVGLSKFVYFTTFDSLPGVGIAFEAILPEVYLGVRGPGGERLGFGDTIWGVATWIKPTENSTLGIQTFIQGPIGDEYFRGYYDYYSNYTSILFDVQSPNLSFTGDVGGVFRSQQTRPGALTVDGSSTFHTNLRLGYKLNMPSFPVEPFVALDYFYNTAQKYALTNSIYTNQSQDLALGAGLMWTYDPKQSLTVRYSRSVYGENIVPTNAVYVKWALVF